MVSVGEGADAVTVPQGAEPPDEALPQPPLALDAAFRVYAPYVAAIAFKLLGRDHEVDDVVQDVFLAGHRGLASLRIAALLY